MSSVSLFIPCIVDQWLPDIGVATFTLLRHAGCRPYYRSEQTCCGQVLYNAGHINQTRKLARRFIKIFEEDEAIVCPSASCVAMVRNNYPLLFENDPSWRMRAENLAPRVYELFEFLADKMEISEVGASFTGKAAYHESCSQRFGLNISDRPKQMIQAVKGLETVPMDGADICCGFGGRFSIDYPDISTAMVAGKAASFVATGADLLILCEPGCLLNIGGYMNRHYPDKRVVHLASFLADHIREHEGGHL